jgi:hypothetical protein
VTPGISTAPLKVRNVRSLVLVSCAATPLVSTASAESASAVAINFTRFMRFLLDSVRNGWARERPRRAEAATTTASATG